MKVTCKTNNLIYDKQPHYFISLTIGKSYQVLDISENPKFRVYGGDLKTLFYQIEDRRIYIIYIFDTRQDPKKII